MTIYRWQAGEVVPDATLEASLGLATGDNLEGWLQEAYPHVMLQVGKEYYSMRLACRFSDRNESCLVDLSFTTDYSMFIWCEHWGVALACLKWLMPLMAQERRFSHAVEVAEYVTDLADAAETRQVDAHAKLIDAGYTVDEVERLEDRRMAREQKRLERLKDARAKGSS